jgi:Ca2+-binding RTX toxin-like protein
VVETGGGVDTVRSSVTELLGGGVEKLLLTGAAAINGTGNTLANTITGNSGANLLDGKGGVDTLRGMGGNDTLVWAATDTCDGGEGTDTLKLTGGNLNLTTVTNTKIRNVEYIDLTRGGNNRLTLNLSDVIDISSTTNTLKVLGSTGDSVDIVGTFTIGGLSGYYGDFRTYRLGTGTLLIDTDITVI